MESSHVPKNTIKLKLLHILKISSEIVVRHYLESKVEIEGRKDSVELSNANGSLAMNCLQTKTDGNLWVTFR